MKTKYPLLFIEKSRAIPIVGFVSYDLSSNNQSILYHRCTSVYRHAEVHHAVTDDNMMWLVLLVIHDYIYIQDDLTFSIRYRPPTHLLYSGVILG